MSRYTMGRRNSMIGLAALLALCGLTCAPRGGSLKDGSNGQVKNNSNSNGDEAVAELKPLLDRTLKEIKARPLEPGHGFWTIFHAILGMGLDTELILDKQKNLRVKAIDYIAEGKPMPGLEFQEKRNGLNVISTGPLGGVMSFSQGHQDQFIAEMAQWGISPHKVFLLPDIKDKKFTFMDFCKHSKMRASVNKHDEMKKQELSWAVIIVGQFFGEGDLYKKNNGEVEYLPWQNEKGETLNYEDMVRYELDEPIVRETACGGTHRLFGLTWAYYLHLRRGGKTTGVWRDLVDKIDHYKKQARALQNYDGSFSTNWFEDRGDAQGAEERIAKTGHTLEWLALALRDSELKEPWVERAVRAQCLMVLRSSGSPLEGGGLYHATHGLNLYDARVFGGQNDPRLPPVPLPPKK